MKFRVRRLEILPDADRVRVLVKLDLVTVASPAATAAATSAAVSTIASAATTTAVATAATTTAAFGLGPRFIYVDGASADLRTVESGNCLFSIFVAGHLNETKAARAAGIAIGHDAHAVDLSVRFEELPKFIFIGVEAEIPHKNILHASASALSCRMCEQLGGLAREFLKIGTGAGEQSIAASSIAGSR
jgi:hypothetical protein